VNLKRKRGEQSVTVPSPKPRKVVNGVHGGEASQLRIKKKISLWLEWGEDVPKKGPNSRGGRGATILLKIADTPRRGGVKKLKGRERRRDGKSAICQKKKKLGSEVMRFTA